MAKLNIQYGETGIIMRFFGNRIFVQKQMRELTNEIRPAVIQWLPGESLSEWATEFAEWLSRAADVAKTLDYVILTPEDLGLTPMPPGCGGNDKLAKRGKRNDKRINYNREITYRDCRGGASSFSHGQNPGNGSRRSSNE